MPRKRNTQAQKTRAKPKLKNSDENEDALSEQEKKKKLENYLNDFDMQGLNFGLIHLHFNVSDIMILLYLCFLA